MTKIVRNKCFETNSSSTHSLTIVELSEYDDWKDGKLLFDCNNKKFVIKRYASNKRLSVNGAETVDDDYMTYEQYQAEYNDSLLKTVEKRIKIDSIEEEFIIFGYCGFG